MTVLYDLRKYNELISIDNLKQISKIEYNYLITNSHKDNGIYLYHIARCSQYGIHCKQDDNNAYSTFLKSFEKGYCLSEIEIAKYYISGIKNIDSLQNDNLKNEKKGFEILLKYADLKYSSVLGSNFSASVWISVTRLLSFTIVSKSLFRFASTC